MNAWRVPPEAGPVACGHLQGLPDEVAPASECHPVVASAEPGERWGWCCPDELPLVHVPG